MHGKFTIDFCYKIEEFSISIQLSASVEYYADKGYYCITEIGNSTHKGILPEMDIRKLGGKWVHIDSKKESALSEVVGKAIDEKLNSLQSAEGRSKSNID